MESPNGSSSPEEPKVEIEKEESTTEKDEFREKYYYLAAEMENTRKRFEKEKENLLKYGQEKILSQLLDVMDNFERILWAMNSDSSSDLLKDPKVKNLLIGIEMVKNQFLSTLTQNGVGPIEIAGGQFDPLLQEAVSMEFSTEIPANQVIKELAKGYKLNGRVLRASKVVVSKGPENNEDSTTNS